MARRRLKLALVTVVAGAVLAACGTSSSTPTSTLGAVYVLIGDTPVCDILSFRLTVTGLSATPMTGSSSTILSSTVTAIKVGVSALQEFSTVLSVTSLTQNTFTTGMFAYSAPTVVLYDPAENPPILSVTATAASTTPTSFPVEPPVTVSSTLPAVMQIDMDLRHSVQLQTNAQGQVTAATVAPALTVTGLTASSSGFIELDDLLGFVTSVNPNPITVNSEGFAGTVNVQLLSSTISGSGGPAVGVSIPTDYFSANIVCGPPTESNQPCSPVMLNQLPTGSFVELDAMIDPKGNLVAESMQLEDVENALLNKLAFIGDVLSAPTTDASGNVTFNLFILEEEPDVEFSVPVDSVVTVTAPASTVYGVGQPANDFAGLGFSAGQLAFGQQVVVHGTFTRPTPPLPPAPTPLTTVAAEKVFLKLQTHLGNFSSLLQDGSDDHTGVFVLSPCASLFADAPIYVATDRATNFVNFSGLNALTSQPTLAVKGLLERLPQATTVNGVKVPAGSLLLLAKQIHQLS